MLLVYKCVLLVTMWITYMVFMGINFYGDKVLHSLLLPIEFSTKKG